VRDVRRYLGAITAQEGNDVSQNDMHRMGNQPPLNVPADLAVARERAAVVRYLRARGLVTGSDYSGYPFAAADAIERGEHLTEPTPGITASPAHGTSGTINGDDTT
jgi:hypothetical protein